MKYVKLSLFTNTHQFYNDTLKTNLFIKWKNLQSIIFNMSKLVCKKSHIIDCFVVLHFADFTLMYHYRLRKYVFTVKLQNKYTNVLNHYILEWTVNIPVNK